MLFISGSEVFVVVIVVYLFFGSKKMPSILRDLGKAIRTLRNTSDQIKEDIMNTPEEHKASVKDLRDVGAQIKKIPEALQTVSRSSHRIRPDEENKIQEEEEKPPVNESKPL